MNDTEKKSMQPIIFTWNIKNWNDWENGYAQCVQKTQQDIPQPEAWRTAKNEIPTGTIAILVMLMNDQTSTGVIGMGQTTGPVITSKNIDENKSKHVPIDWQILLPFKDIITSKELETIAPKTFIINGSYQNPRQSGSVFIKPTDKQKLIDEIYRRHKPQNNNSLPPNTYERIKVLKQFKNLILEGVPGTGKTFALKAITQQWKNKDQTLEGNGNGEYAITFHPSTSYEDFVEGLRPKTSQNASKKVEAGEWFFNSAPETDGNWNIKDGFFLKACRNAYLNPTKDYIILIDEINRANVPKVLGDLLTTIERSKRAVWVSKPYAPKDGKSYEHIDFDFFGKQTHWDLEKCQIVTLPYSGRKFFVPANIYIVATMNTTDRSVAPLDAALRRRFAFEQVEPMPLKDIQAAFKDIPQTEYLKTSLKVWADLNKELEKEIGSDGKLGHSYFMVLRDELKEDNSDIDGKLRMVWRQEILPQLIDVVVSANQTQLFSKKYSQTLSENSTIAQKIQSVGFNIYRKGQGLSESLNIETISPSVENPIKSDDEQEINWNEFFTSIVDPEEQKRCIQIAPLIIKNFINKLDGCQSPKAPTDTGSIIFKFKNKPNIKNADTRHFLALPRHGKLYIWLADSDRPDFSSFIRRITNFWIKRNDLLFTLTQLEDGYVHIPITSLSEQNARLQFIEMINEILQYTPNQ